MSTCRELDNSTRNALLGARLSELQARELFRQGEEAVVFALLELSKRLAEAQGKADPSVTPSTPSGMVATYKKPPTSQRGKKRPGAKKGHSGSRRRLRWPFETLCRDPRALHRRYPRGSSGGDQAHDPPRLVPAVQEKVEPPVVDALPGSQLGNRVLVLSAWLHYALGNTLSQIVEVFNFHLQLKITEGGLMQMWYRLQEILYAWYEQIREEALQSAVLHGDETGWRTDGKTHWL